MDVTSISNAFTEVSVQAVKPPQIAAPNAVPTELPTQQAVSSAWGAEPVRSDVSSHAAFLSSVADSMTPTPEQRYERDQDTDVLVFKQIDPSSGKVLLQLPDQSLLNLRAYLKQMKTNAAPKTAKLSVSKSA